MALGLLPVVTVSAALFPRVGLFRTIAWADTVYLALSGLWLFLNGLCGRYTNGANDNGSGSALALALARRAAQGELPAARLMFVFTGSEETGNRGMLHFLRRFTRAFPAARPFFVNLDNLGRGIPRYLEGEGMLGYTRYDARLIGLARELSAARGERVMAQRNLLLPTDAVVAARAGYPAITFIATDSKGQIPDYHWHTDVPANLDRSLLEFMEEYLIEYLRRLLAAHTDS
ncbi:MAG: M28 family peptidase [Limnochordales bacterium]|nr:M28 family peptidase [Limnochordales bacterium]